MSDFIEHYDTVVDLRRQIIDKYIKECNALIKMHESILADKSWASDGSEYHNNYRKRMQDGITTMQTQIQLLTSKRKGL